MRDCLFSGNDCQDYSLLGCKVVYFSWLGTGNYEELLPSYCALKIEASCSIRTLVSISTTPRFNINLIFVLQINKDGSFLIKDLQHSDEGNYSCSVENVHGNDEIVYSVRVLGMSYFLLQALLLWVYHTDISSYSVYTAQMYSAAVYILTAASTVTLCVSHRHSPWLLCVKPCEMSCMLTSFKCHRKRYKVLCKVHISDPVMKREYSSYCIFVHKEAVR
jgi:hypothetical protein